MAHHRVILNKLRAYELQDQGADTVEANERLGFKADLRDYQIPRGGYAAHRRIISKRASVTYHWN